MSDLILLRDKCRCPQCRARRSFSGGNCSNCGMRLFINPINFKQFEDDGNDRRYWLWTNDNGWIYRDHVIEGLKPLSQSFEISSPEPTTEETQKRRLAEVREDTNRKVRELID